MAQEVAQLLVDWRNSNQAALDRLTHLVYEELRQTVEPLMSRKYDDHTLQTTALVHEAYLRLFGEAEIERVDRVHFFAIATRQMRRILIDLSRKKGAAVISHRLDSLLHEDLAGSEKTSDVDLIALDKALDELEKIDERACRVVELRYIGGLTEKEAAEALNISVATLKRDWAFAKAWLLHELSHGNQWEDEDNQLLDDDIREHKVDRPLPYLNMKSLDLSASRLALYLLASTVVASILLQLLTDDEMVIFFGTLNLAIISAWIWAWLRKIRLTLQYFRGTQQSRSEQPHLGELGNARQQ